MAKKYTVECMGRIWIMNRPNFKKLMHDISLGKDYDLDSYGKMIDSEIYKVTGMKADEARNILVEV